MGKAGQDFQKPAAIPTPKKSAVSDNYHGTIIHDPYRWMENLEDPIVREWASAQNDKTQNLLHESPVLETLRQEIEFALDYQKESLVEQRGDSYFLTYNTGKMQQDALAIRKTPLGDTKILIDPNTWSEKGTTSLQKYSINEDGSLIAYAKSVGGEDLSSVEIMDVKTGKLLNDKIEKTRWPSFIWKGSEGFYYNIPATDDSKRRKVKYHVVGTDSAQDADIFCHEKAGTIAEPYQIGESTNLWIELSDGTDKNNGLWHVDAQQPGEARQILKFGIANIKVIGEVGNDIFLETSYGANHKRIMKFDINNPAVENWKEVLPEHAEDVIDKSFVHRDKLYVTYLADCAHRVEVFGLDGVKIKNIPVSGFSIVNFGDPTNKSDDMYFTKKSDDIYFSVSNDLADDSFYRIDTLSGEVHEHRKSKCTMNLEGCIVERLIATSKDGTKVPMTVIRRPDVPLDGTAATCIYGYGGFNNSVLPGFSYTQWAWVSSGGIFVTTNLRGGGEFGSEWCEQGKLHNKQNVFDDFIACAEKLIEKNYTSPERLMSYGASNGGLLTLATMIQRPDLFKCVYSAVPVTDMLRFMHGECGGFWVSDYGNPVENAEDFKTSIKYSPLHNVKPGAIYPDCLITTAYKDDRVPPWHAIKQAATLLDQCPESKVYLQVNMNTGHGAGKSKSQTAETAAKIIAWAERSMGPFEPLEYKPSLEQKIEQEVSLVCKL